MSIKRTSLYIQAALALLIIVTFFTDINTSVKALTEGATICARSVIPFLFPLMISSDLLSRISIGKRSYALQLILGWTFGLPVCALGASKLFVRNQIDRRTYNVLISIGGIPSIGFFMGYCKNLFGMRYAVGLYITSILSASICGAILYATDKSTSESAKALHVTSDINDVGITEILSESIKSSTQRCLTVIGCVSFFYMLSSRITATISNSVMRALIFGFFEFSGGCSACASLDERQGYVLCSAIIAFSGLSAYMQTASIQRSFGITPYAKSYLLAKAMQALTAALISICTVYRNKLPKITLAIIFFITLLALFCLLQRINKKPLKNHKSICYNTEKFLKEEVSCSVKKRSSQRTKTQYALCVNFQVKETANSSAHQKKSLLQETAEGLSLTR